MEMIDKTFGRWTVIDRAKKTSCGKPRWLCRCQCGKEKVVYERYPLKGSSASCGCLRREMLAQKNTTHGHSVRGKVTAEYHAWFNIRERCYDPGNKEYHNYGGRGIKVCDRWLNSFEAFIEDMGSKPTPKHQIDRFPNNDGNYEPGNCRWATPLENASNKRNTVYLEHDGKRLTQSEWARITGLSNATINERRAKGWPDSKVLTTPRTPGRKAI